MTDVSKRYGLQWKSEFSAVTEIQVGRPSVMGTRPSSQDQDQNQCYRTKTKTKIIARKTKTEFTRSRQRPTSVLQDQDQDRILLVWDRSCNKTKVSDHIAVGHGAQILRQSIPSRRSCIWERTFSELCAQLWQRVVDRQRGTEAGTCTAGTSRLDDVDQICQTRWALPCIYS